MRGCPRPGSVEYPDDHSAGDGHAPAPQWVVRAVEISVTRLLAQWASRIDEHEATAADSAEWACVTPLPAPTRKRIEGIASGFQNLDLCSRCLSGLREHYTPTRLPSGVAGRCNSGCKGEWRANAVEIETRSHGWHLGSAAHHGVTNNQSHSIKAMLRCLAGGLSVRFPPLLVL